MPRVLVAGKIHADGLAILRQAPGVVVDYVEEVSAESYRPFLPTADALLIRTQPLTAGHVEEAPNLRIVSRHGVGYDSVDVGALNSRHIPLAVVGDVNSRAVAEHAAMLMLAAARRTVLFDRKMRAGDWNYRNSLDATELDGGTLLLVGFGRIGKRLAQIAGALGMTVLAYDKFQDAAGIAAAGVIPVDDLMDGLRRADVVSLHVPKVGDKALIGAAELAVMKPSAILVNTARGGLIDEAALVAALDEGRIAAAGLDVFEDEPPRADSPLLANERVVMSPHNAGLTEACARRMAVAAAQNILDFFKGTLDPALVVNRAEIAARRPATIGALEDPA
ncbi:hydroxyacid dehydrogenase [Shinella sp. HZN7]|uniref:hydroxyacid dehydrogenase n=1 Tax=Shinella sp. (strain HZN7) TaxID=879274 RepID=UPI0007DAAC5E|nr:hydroxyacid dehydrogenase [Shinella sp. HZN7]ANH03088.1 3-phosphoglycerate dehydrogenase [Shinella sp. HZN7]